MNSPIRRAAPISVCSLIFPVLLSALTAGSRVSSPRANGVSLTAFVGPSASRPAREERGVSEQEPEGSSFTRRLVPARKRALVVGVNRTNGMAELKYASADADAFANALRTELGFTNDEVRILTSDRPDGLPTRAAFFAGLDALLGEATLQRSDLFVVYFSGHGVGSKGGDYLLPTDGDEARPAETAIRVNDVLERVTRRGLRNVVLIADACRSGDKSEFGADLVEQVRRANVALMLGCAPGSRSYEYPRLGHGVFTHFLLRAIADPANVDEFGALWTSRLAADVGARAERYTAVDYGDDAQRPAGWADPARDVMVRVVPKSLDPGSIIRLARRSRELTPEMYAASAATYALGLLDQERYEETATLLRGADAVAPLDAWSIYLLGLTLVRLGRDGEAHTIFERLIAGSDPYLAAYAVLADFGSHRPARERRAAALRAWPLAPHVDRIGMVLGSLRLFGTSDDVVRFLDEAIPLVPASSRYATLLNAERAYHIGKEALALSLYETALTKTDSLDETLSSSRTESDLIVSILGELISLPQDDATFERLIGGYRTYAATPCEAGAEEAYRRAVRGQRDKAAALAVEAAGRPGLNSGTMHLLVQATGYQAARLAPAFAAYARAHPADVRAQIYDLVVGSFANGAPIEMEELRRRVLARTDDDLTALSTIYRETRSILEDGVLENKMDSLELQRLDARLSPELYRQAVRFGRRSDLWSLLEVGWLNGRRSTIQLTTLFDRLVGPPTDDDDETLALTRMNLAIRTGDWPRMRSLWKAGGVREPLRTMTGWGLVVNIWAHGETAEAKRIAGEIGAPTEGYAIRPSLLRLIAANDLDAIVATPPKHPLESGMIGIALARRGRWDEARPALGRAIATRTPLFFPAEGEILRLLAEDARRRRDTARLGEVYLWGELKDAANPIFARAYPGLRPDRAAFAADYVGTGSYGPDSSDPDGTFEARAYPDGRFEGTLKPKGLPSIEIRARFDEYGELTGESKLGETRMAVRAKLVPPEFQRFADGSPTYQTLLLDDGRGIAIALFITPKGASGPRSKTGPNATPPPAPGRSKPAGSGI